MHFIYFPFVVSIVYIDGLISRGNRVIYFSLGKSVYFRHRHFYESINGGEPTCIDDDIPFDIPDSWEWVKLSSIADVKGGKRIPAGMQTTTEKTAHVYIRVADMVNGTISDRNLVYITEEVFQKISRYTISKNDLYLTIAGTIGKAGVVPELLDGMNLTENAVKITNISVNKNFLLQLLQSDFCQSQFVDKTTCVAQPKLAIERILSVMLPIPPPNEQNRILDAVSNRFKKLNVIIDSRRKYKRILSETPTSLRQQLIQAAIQGRLVPQNPDDEPASALLKRIAQERTAKLGKKAAKSMSRIERRGSKTRHEEWVLFEADIANASPELQHVYAALRDEDGVVKSAKDSLGISSDETMYRRKEALEAQARRKGWGCDDGQLVMRRER